MRIIDRVVLLILSLVLAGIGVLEIFFSFNINEATIVLNNFVAEMINYRWLILISGALLVVIGVVFIFGCAFHTTNKNKNASVNSMEQGENVQVSMNAITCIIQQLAKAYPAIGDVRPNIRQTADGVDIAVRVVADSNANLPDLASHLQNTITNQLENMAGLKVSKVKIIIADVNEKPIDIEAIPTAKIADSASSAEANGTAPKK